MFYSSMGDDINTTMTKTVSGGGALTAQVNFTIEEHFDYAFLEASSNGTTWTPLAHQPLAARLGGSERDQRERDRDRRHDE